MAPRTEQLNGRKKMREDKELNCDVYTTNFGSVYIDKTTGDVPYACVALGRNPDCEELDCTIIDGEFQITKRFIGKIQKELCSPGYPYPNHSSQSISLHDVFELLKRDTNLTVPAIAVKKQLVRLLQDVFKFTQQDNQELKEVFNVWRKPIVLSSSNK